MNCPVEGRSIINCQGFTLVELVLVIMLVGIVAISVSGILGNSVNVITNVAEREELVREGSYLSERIQRELRSAVPNSVRVAGNANVHCVEFVPMKYSTIYLDLPLAGSGDTTVDVLELSNINNNLYVPTGADFAIVYPTQPSQVYDITLAHRQSISSCSDDGDGSCATLDDSDKVVQLTVAGGFAQQSPSRRVYFADRAVSFCLRDQQVYRHESSIALNQTIYTSGGILMAKNVTNVLGADPLVGSQNPFRQINASLVRNASTQTFFKFSANDENVSFMQEVQVPNVP